MIHKSLLLLTLWVAGAASLILTGAEAQAQSDDDYLPPAFESSDNEGDRGGRGGRGVGGERGESRGDRGFGGRGFGDRGFGGREFGGRRNGLDSGNPPGGQAPGPAGAKPKVRVGRVGPKPPPAPKLPADYVGRDTNRDGQIGLYEWSKNDLSTFSRLDTNRDGFLVPAELVNPGSGSRGSAVANVIVPTGKGPAATFTSSSATVAAPGAPAADPKIADAGNAFDFLDANKDGALSAEEWERSRNARKRFADAKFEVQIPLTKAKFVENYVKLP